MKAQRFTEAMGEVHPRYITESIQYRKEPQKRALAKWGALAACSAILLAAWALVSTGLLSAPFRGSISVHAKGTDQEITAAGIVIRTGSIRDTGEMTGKPLMFYLSGEGIASVRFSCKNQQLRFTDWTEQREEYGKARNFTVAYGPDASEYYYLTIDWEIDAIIRELTDRPDSSIATLEEEMRHDLIVMEITFENQETATKAIAISLLDDGSFFASFDEYEIAETDTFVRRPDSPAIPREILYAQDSVSDIAPMVCAEGRLYRQSKSEAYYEDRAEDFLYLGTIESDISHDPSVTDGIPTGHLQANHPIVGAEVYQYGSHIVVLINGKYWLYEALEESPKGQGPLDDGTDTQGGLTEEEKMQLDPSYTEGLHDSPDEGALSAAEEAARAYYANTVFEIVSMETESRTGDEIIFTVSVKKGGILQEPGRRIVLKLKYGTWEVENEGY